jgi:hypothetical protein
MKRSAAVETGRLALSDRAADLLATDIAGEVCMSAIRAAAGRHRFPPGTGRKSRNVQLADCCDRNQASRFFPRSEIR